jgi:Xaa-Pro dipeptidase
MDRLRRADRGGGICRAPGQGPRADGGTGIDALLVNAGASLRYFAGVPWSASERLVAMVVLPEGRPQIVAPRFEHGSLEADLAIAADLHGWEEHEIPCPGRRDPARRAGRAPGGRSALPFQMALRLQAAAPGITLLDGGPIIDACRSIKSEAELALMRQAKQMTLEVHRRVARILHPGITAGAVTRFIEAAHRALGAAGNSFCIVEFGRGRRSPRPAGRAAPGAGRCRADRHRLLRAGLHVRHHPHYVYGTPGAEHRRIWNLEREAQQAAFDAVKPGVPCEAIDAAARRVLEARRAGAGLSPARPAPSHRPWHRPVDPRRTVLVRGDTTPLAPGMCFSNEPMIVLPDRFGIRLEDHFHVTETGAQWFTEPSHAIDDPSAWRPDRPITTTGKRP